METAFIFLFGLSIGSFLNVIIHRLHEGGSIVFGRSRCPHCGHGLLWYELVPLLSFALQRGRCRACGGRISWQYPAVEFATALAFVFLWERALLPYYGVEIAYLFFVFASLIIIFVFDLKWYIIPNRVLYPLTVVVLLHPWLGSPLALVPHPFWAASGAAGFFLVLFLASRGTWIGFGDVKFGAFMGLFLGFPLTVVALFFSYCIGGMVSGALLARGSVALKSQIPFGPFLIVGTAIAYAYGHEIIWWYLNIM